jgi:hyaluronate lyase
MTLKKSGKKIIILLVCVAVITAVLLGITASTKNAEYVSPSKDAPIDVSIKGEEKAVMALIADPQISFYSPDRYSVFKAAMVDLHNTNCEIDALIGAGDITENATKLDYSLIKAELAGIDTRYILASGNHDIRVRFYKQSLGAFSDLANELNGDDAMNSYHYSEVIEGYKVIVLGSDKTKLEQAYISPEQLQWLDSEVAAEEGKPTFVICHQPLKDTHNEMNAFGSITKAGGHVGEQSQDIQDVLAKYDNVFFISGHLHSGFGPDSYNEVDGIHCINIPSTAIVNKDGTYNNAGTGYIMEVYEEKVIFRARNFAEGVWVAEATGDNSYDIEINIEK